VVVTSPEPYWLIPAERQRSISLSVDSEGFFFT
jgi:hypothetical protein